LQEIPLYTWTHIFTSIVLCKFQMYVFYMECIIRISELMELLYELVPK
jgi:hypothetical protein